MFTHLLKTNNICYYLGVYKLVVTGASGSKLQKLVTLTVKPEGGDSGKSGVNYTPIPVAEFGVHVSDLHANRNSKFKDHYLVSDSVLCVGSTSMCSVLTLLGKYALTMEA